MTVAYYPLSTLWFNQLTPNRAFTISTIATRAIILIEYSGSVSA
jgi:ABC-type nitrate/sulfonate/bicarbonate transport system permease component